MINYTHIFNTTIGVILGLIIFNTFIKPFLIKNIPQVKEADKKYLLLQLKELQKEGLIVQNHYHNLDNSTPIKAVDLITTAINSYGKDAIQL